MRRGLRYLRLTDPEIEWSVKTLCSSSESTQRTLTPHRCCYVFNILCVFTPSAVGIDDPLLKWISRDNARFAMFDSHQLRKNPNNFRRGSKNSANFSNVWSVCGKRLALWVFLKITPQVELETGTESDNKSITFQFSVLKNPSQAKHKSFPNLDGWNWNDYWQRILVRRQLFVIPGSLYPSLDPPLYSEQQ